MLRLEQNMLVKVVPASCGESINGDTLCSLGIVSFIINLLHDETTAAECPTRAKLNQR